jgi:hypothetical protein
MDAYSVYAADFDGDGDYDVLSNSEFQGKIAWYSNELDADQAFGSEQVIVPYDEVDGAQDVFTSDLDGDGDMDVLSASINDDKVAWYENLGSGSFGSQQVISSSLDRAYDVSTADVDGDGDQDVLAAALTFSDDPLMWFENVNGEGNFGPPNVVTNALANASAVMGADLDGDGDKDILAASTDDSEKVTWYENQIGEGSADSDGFGNGATITTNANEAWAIDAADLDGDGDQDVLSASNIDNKIAWYENLNGDGGFSTQKVITSDALSARAVYAADLDGDGDQDVLSASRSDDKIAWYSNDGGGAFSTQRVIASDADGALSVTAADLNGDGKLDVLSASGFDDKVTWYKQETSFGQVSFSAGQPIVTNAAGANTVHTADLDNDGDHDVLSSAGNEIAWYENTETTLPVELIGLWASTYQSAVRIEWETASETNNAGFHVQRRHPATFGWSEIGFVEGSGNTSSRQRYQFLDVSLPQGASKLEYRLKQVDLDGDENYSSVVEVTVGALPKLILQNNYPNPFSKATVIRYSLPNESHVQLDVYDIRGRKVTSLVDEKQHAGVKAITWKPDGLGSGMYLVRLRVNGQAQWQKLNFVR